MAIKLQPCLRCGVDDVEVREWFLGDATVPLFRCECANGHVWDEWFENKDDAIKAWNEKPVEGEYENLR
jgi:hypothetical protein